jgi:hypothetical protein
MSDEERKEDSGVGEVPGKPGVRAKTTPSGEARAIKIGRLQRNAHWVALIGGLIPAVAASVVSVVTAYKGEPEANRSHELLAPQVNAQKISLQIILSRLSKIEGHYAGMAAGKLEAKIDMLLKENAALKARTPVTTPVPGVKKVQPPKGGGGGGGTAMGTISNVPKCKKGQVIGDDKKCHWVQKAVAAKVKAQAAKTKDYQRRLREKHEWLRREKAKRRQLEQKVRMLKQRPYPKPMSPPPLKAVPESLDKK